MNNRTFLCSCLVWIFLLVAMPYTVFAQGPSTTGLLGHWRFDDTNPAEVVNSAHTGERHPAKTSGVLSRVPGVFGHAVDLSGSFRIEEPATLIPDNLETLTFSAWIMPRSLSHFREIIRKEDGSQRFLFSFQNNGEYLSLGLHTNGRYRECDAPICSSDLCDGNWHFIAAVFNGQTMSVWLDGQVIGSLDSPGKLVIGKKAPVMIGSSCGNSEFFDGLLDDLRFYARPLTAEELWEEYKRGSAALLTESPEATKFLDSFYVKKDTCLQTARMLRQVLASRPDLRRQLDRHGRKLVTNRLKRDFKLTQGALPPLFQSMNITPYDLVFSGNTILSARLELFLDKVTEYMPITQTQWQYTPPEEKGQWKNLQEITSRLRQRDSQVSEDKLFETFELLVKSPPALVQRPLQREAVAPWQPATTPPVEERTASQSRSLIESDWLFQCDNNPSKERILHEIKYALALADRLEEETVSFAKERADLVRLQAEAERLSGPSASLYFRVRTIKRTIMFANPLLDFDTVLYVDAPYPQGKEWRHETRHRLGYMAVPGGRLMTLSGLSPDGRQNMLMPQAPLAGSFWRPDLAWDAKKVLFCFKPHNEKSFHLYEIDIDGKNIRQLTAGIFDDLDPVYLPDGQHIAFSTTRGHSYVRCMPPTNAYVLARMKLDSSSLYLISRNNEPDYLPSVLPDGRLIYTRWEYTDKPLWRAQSLWTVNPDGTQPQTFWGNQSVWPDLLKDARAVPGSNRVIFTGSAHHDWFAGSLGMIDPTKGLNFPDGLTQITPDISWPECGRGPGQPIESPDYHSSGKYSAYDSPYPLGEKDFLVSACKNGRFVLLLMDTDGNRELINEGAHNIFFAQPVRPREKPPVLVDRVDWPTRENRLQPAPGIIYSNNVYDNAPESLRGKAKYLRILNIEPKTYTFWDHRPYISTGPVVSMVQSEGVKRILGTVPIEKDGSVAFYAPSGVALHFQLLDEQKRCLQTMRSFTGVMPGERRGCLGCHESQIVSPTPQTRSIAVSKEPVQITPPAWPDISISYERYVQPVLDKHCGECHQGKGEATKVFDLTPRPGFLHFKEPYITLIGNPSWGTAPKLFPAGSRLQWGDSSENELETPPPGFGIADTIQIEAFEKTDPAGYVTPTPMEKLSYASRLINKYCSKEHYNVQLSPIEKERLIVWVDAICPYLGSDDIRAMPDPVFPGSNWLAITPRLETAPVIRRPGPFDPFNRDDAYNPPGKDSIYANPAQGKRP